VPVRDTQTHTDSHTNSAENIGPSGLQSGQQRRLHCLRGGGNKTATEEAITVYGMYMHANGNSINNHIPSTLLIVLQEQDHNSEIRNIKLYVFNVLLVSCVSFQCIYQEKAQNTSEITRGRQERKGRKVCSYNSPETKKNNAVVYSRLHEPCSVHYFASPYFA